MNNLPLYLQKSVDNNGILCYNIYVRLGKEVFIYDYKR